MLRILLFHKGGIGDIVFALPLIRDLRRAYPAAEITALTHESGREIFRFCPQLTEVLSIRTLEGAWSARDATKVLLGRQFDIALTTARSLRAAGVLWRVEAPIRVGFSSLPEALLFTHRAKVRPFEVVFARRYQRLAEALGLPIGDAVPRLAVPDEALDAAQSRLAAAGWEIKAPLIGLHIGGGWPTKRWPVENMVELIRSASSRHGWQVLLQGGREDVARAEEIIRRVPPESVLNRVGNRISETIAEAALCSVTVGIDSGLSHAAAACGVPTICLFGPNDERSIAPAAHQRTLVRDLPCRPCNRAGRWDCPLGHHRCMRDIQAPHVLQLMDEFVSLREKPGLLESALSCHAGDQPR